MKRAYKQICAYAGLYIESATGSPTVDHFIAKTSDPGKAYDWDNFRLSSLLLNSRKGTNPDVLDPFTIGQHWFVIDFFSLFVKPNPLLPPLQKLQVRQTIESLKLDTDERLIEQRREWLCMFGRGELNFHGLERKAPFVAGELTRQKLVRNSHPTPALNKLVARHNPYCTQP